MNDRADHMGHQSRAADISSGDAIITTTQQIEFTYTSISHPLPYGDNLIVSVGGKGKAIAAGFSTEHGRSGTVYFGIALRADGSAENDKV